MRRNVVNKKIPLSAFENHKKSDQSSTEICKDSLGSHVILL